MPQSDYILQLWLAPIYPSEFYLLTPSNWHLIIDFSLPKYQRHWTLRFFSGFVRGDSHDLPKGPIGGADTAPAALSLLRELFRCVCGSDQLEPEFYFWAKLGGSLSLPSRPSGFNGKVSDDASNTNSVAAHPHTPLLLSARRNTADASAQCSLVHRKPRTCELWRTPVCNRSPSLCLPPVMGSSSQMWNIKQPQMQCAIFHTGRWILSSGTCHQPALWNKYVSKIHHWTFKSHHKAASSLDVVILFPF